MTLTALAIYVVAGVGAGLLSGILGIGGGIVVVPSLLFIFSHDPAFPPSLVMHFAAGTSLAVMLFTSQSAIRAHYQLNAILWDVYKRLWPGIVVGTLCGALLADFLATYWLKIFFGVFLLFVAFRMLAPVQVTDSHHFPRRWINGLVSFLIGFKSGLLGVGGGALIIPYLSYCGLEMRKIAPISALCTLTVAAIGTITFIVTGFNEMDLPAYSMGYIYWPAVVCIAIFSSFFAPLGAKLTYILPVQKLRYGFVGVLVLTAVHLLI